MPKMLNALRQLIGLLVCVSTTAFGFYYLGNGGPRINDAAIAVILVLNFLVYIDYCLLADSKT